MEGRQYFPGYGGTYQPVPDFNATGYSRGYGVPGSYFMAGPTAGMVALIFHVFSSANVRRLYMLSIGSCSWNTAAYGTATWHAYKF